MKKLNLIIFIITVMGFLVGCKDTKSSAPSTDQKVEQPSRDTVDPTSHEDEDEDDTEEEDEDEERVTRKDKKKHIVERRGKGVSTRLYLVDGVDRLSDYTERPMNDPKTIRISLDFRRVTSTTHKGNVSITYQDAGESKKATFSTGSQTKAISNNTWFDAGCPGSSGKLRTIKAHEDKYTYDVLNGENVCFHAILQDDHGGLVITIRSDIQNVADNIREVCSTDDGASNCEFNYYGEVYFKNFKKTYAPQSPTYCWFVSIGPYDCQPHFNGSVTPHAGYVRLGQFGIKNGKEIEKIFGNTLGFDLPDND